jgi:sugar (pentulose or hexulose) kinase
VAVSAEPEATSRGAAMLALHTLGALPSLESIDLAEEKVYEPDRARHAIYQEAIARQRWLYDRLIVAS